MHTTWLDTTEYPFTSHYMTINGHRMHYIDEGSGETILFVHGTPSWSFESRNVIGLLKQNYRCIAVDHIGFGLSDKPERYDYSTRNHSLTLEKFILANDLKDITLVMHDFGGPIGLHFALRHASRVKRLVVMNSWMWSSASDPAFIKFRRVLKSPLLPVLYKYFNFSPRYLMPSAFESKPAKHILKHFTSPFGKPSERIGTIAFAKSLLNDQDWFQQLWDEREKLSGKPVMFIWGVNDRFITPAYLDTFVSGFPAAMVARLENCGHFPLEEKPKEVAFQLQLFMLERSLEAV